VKIQPQCDHQSDDRRCLDSAGYRIMQSFSTLRDGRFCLRHAKAGASRHERVVPMTKLPAEKR
jgi:hypothetical protein